jgi:hypothetical protein
VPAAAEGSTREGLLTHFRVPATRRYDAFAADRRPSDTLGEAMMSTRHRHDYYDRWSNDDWDDYDNYDNDDDYYGGYRHRGLLGGLLGGVLGALL